MIQTAFLGDVILATPVLEALRQLHPDAQVDVLVRKGHEGLLHNHPGVRQVLTLDKDQPKLRELRRLVSLIRQQQYEAVINIQRFAATGLLTALSGARWTAGFRKNPFSGLFSHRAPHQLGTEPGSPHEVDRNLSLLPEWNDRHTLRPALYPSKADHQAVEAYQQQPYVVIAPASVWYTKQYPKEGWLDLLATEALQPYPVYLIGGPGDHALCERISAQAEHSAIVNLAGQLSFLQTAALIAGATMTYCNDSAPLHMASATNAPVTAIFCSTIPAFGFGPLSDQRYVVEAPTALSCRPCTTHGRPACPLGHYRCAHDITTQQLTQPLTVAHQS